MGSRCKAEQRQACSKKDRGVQKPGQMYDPATQHSASDFAAACWDNEKMKPKLRVFPYTFTENADCTRKLNAITRKCTFDVYFIPGIKPSFSPVIIDFTYNL